jgi:chromosome segregation ATPase
LADILIWTIIFLIAILTAIFLLAIFWQYRMQDSMKRIFGTLRQIQQSAAQKRAESGDYAIDDPEPYGPLAENLLRQIDVVDAAVKELLGRYGVLHTAYRNISLWTWRSLPRFPLDIYNLRNQVNQLDTDTGETSGSLEAVDRIRSELDRQAWKLAGEARLVLEDDLTTARILGELARAGVKDVSLETTVEDTRHWEQLLRGQVPAYFMGEDEDAVKSQADKHTVAQVYRVVNQARPAIDELLKKAHTWQQQQLALSEVLSKLPDDFRHLAEGVAALESAPKHPVAWDTTRGPLAGLRTQIERIGDVKKKRTLEQLEKDRSSAEKLVQKVKDLTAHVTEVKLEHEEFLKILEQPDIAEGVEWSRGAQKLAAQVSNYHPDNWSAEHGVTGLKDELKALDESHQKLAWDSETTPVRESDLPGLLEETRKLEKMHAGLRPKVASIQARLTQVQEAERETRDRLNRAKALLNQAVPLLGANPLLTPNAVKEAEQLRGEIEPMAAEIDTPDQGMVDKKKQKSMAFLQKTNQAGGRWLGILETDLETKKDNLAKKVERLNIVALLEEPALEEAGALIGEVKKGRPAVPGEGSQAGGETWVKPGEEKGLMGVFRRRGKQEIPSAGAERGAEGVTLAEAVSQLKQKNEEWQRCVSLLRALEDIEKPLLERYAKAIEQREAARQLTAKAVELIPDGKNWPPTQQTVSLERQQLEQIEQRWERLHQTPNRAIQVVSTLGALSEEYQGLANRVRQIVERAQQEQTRFVELESRLEESKHLWNQTLVEQEGNRAAQDDIRDMLAQADNELGSIRQRYEGGALPYNQAFQVLRGLCQKVDGALIPLDSQWEVDINGEKVPRESNL